MLNFIWDVSPEIFKIGSLPIRWYGLLFVTGFILSQKIGEYMYKTEGKPTEDVEKIVLYIMFGTLIGARLGHMIFYQPMDLIKNPIEALLPIQIYPEFKFVGYRGLASHGALVGIIVSIFLYTNFHISFKFPFKFKIKREKRRNNQTYLWITSLAAICIAMAGGFIRLGNLMNSEIYGKPTYSLYGVLFANEIKEPIEMSNDIVDNVKINKTKIEIDNKTYIPIDINITFKKSQLDEVVLKKFIENNIKYSLSMGYRVSDHVYEKLLKPLNYSLSKDSQGRFKAIIKTYGKLRHPSQLYEAITCFILFFILFGIWRYRWKTLKLGYLQAIFLFYIFGLRFIYEFYKESARMPGMPSLSRPHILSIGAIIIGILFIIFAQKPKHDNKKPLE